MFKHLTHQNSLSGENSAKSKRNSPEISWRLSWQGDSWQKVALFLGCLILLGALWAVRPWEAEYVSVSGLRFARVVAALVTGASLALATTLLQIVTRNHLADPGLLGVNAGGVLGIVLGISFFQAASFGSYLLWSGSGALLAGLGVAGGGMLLAEKPGASHQLLLFGVAMSGLLGGFANFLLLEQETSLEQFRFWNLGSLSGVRLSDTLLQIPALITACFVLVFLIRPLSLLCLGDEVARSLGVPLWLTKLGALTISASLTAGAISLMGPVMFGGFICATIARKLCPTDLKGALILSGLSGMTLMLVCDTLARTLLSPYEVPVGTVISLAGAPLLMLVAGQRIWSLKKGDPSLE